MARLSDHSARLDAFMASAEAMPFDWKTFNCGFLVADSAVAMGLDDPAARFRDWPERKLKRLSGARLLGAVPFDECPVAFARKGDWLAFDGDTGPALAVCLGKHAAGFRNGEIVRVPTLAAAKAYRVE
tara:strand:+ start:391 stop:774 length:384 start_codon:yes stop_codon:yes gene_type:complete